MDQNYKHASFKIWKPKTKGTFIHLLLTKKENKILRTSCHIIIIIVIRLLLFPRAFTNETNLKKPLISKDSEPITNMDSYKIWNKS